MKPWKLHREDLITPAEWQRLRTTLNRRAELAIHRNTWTGLQEQAVCLLAVWTGLRRAELAALECRDLHLANDRPYVIVRSGKGSLYREVVISPECRMFLKRFLRHKIAFGQPIDGQAPLFVPQRGTRFTGDGVYRIWKSACRRAGIPPRSIHKARHLYATTLYSATKDIRLVQKQLGHSRVTTTTVYADVDDEQTLAGMKALDKQLRPTGPKRPETGRVSLTQARKSAGKRDSSQGDFSAMNVCELADADAARRKA